MQSNFAFIKSLCNIINLSFGIFSIIITTSSVPLLLPWAIETNPEQIIYFTCLSITLQKSSTNLSRIVLSSIFLCMKKQRIKIYKSYQSLLRNINTSHSPPFFVRMFLFISKLVFFLSPISSTSACFAHFKS